MSETIRAFIAIELPGNALAGLGRVQAAMGRSGLAIRWVRPENIHLTLKFLGRITAGQAGRAAAAMAAAGQGGGPLVLAVGGLGVFPGIKRPRVIWAGFSGDTLGLGRLHGRLDAALARIGFGAERRPFRPHATLGRPRGRIDSRKLAEAMAKAGGYAPIAFEAGAIHLVQSRLTPAGAIHTRLETAHLQ